MTVRQSRNLTLLLLSGLTAFRLWYVQTIPLAEDEAYYWRWSLELSWGYFDQGPLIAWLMRLGTSIWGNTELGVRFMGVMLGLGLSLVIYDFCRRVADDETLGFWLVLAANAAPLFSVGSIIHTYDTPQSFFWLLSAHLAALAIFKSRRWAWYGAGLAIGLSMLAKYSSGLMPVLILGFLALSPTYRFWLRRKEPWLAALIAAVVIAPNIWWNATHHWVAFGNTARHVGDHWNFTLFEFLGGQLGLVGPVFFVIVVIALVLAWRQARGGNELLAFLLWLSLPVLAIFTLLSIKTRIQANWPAPGYLTAILAAGLVLRPRLAASRRWRGWCAAGLITGWLLVAVLHFHVPVLRALDVPGDADPTMKVYGWPQLGQAVGEELTTWQGPDDPFIFGLKYQIASLARFYTPGQPPVQQFFPPGRLSSYLWWSDPRDYAGRDALVVIEGSRDLSDFCQRFMKLRDLRLTGPTGKPLHHMTLYRCENFIGTDARPHKFLTPAN